MKLLIVRHAKAFDPDPRRWPDDSERPLTAKGERRFAKSAATIKSLVDGDITVISSPYARALKTAEILCEKTGWPEPQIDDRLSAHYGPEETVELLRSLDVTGNYAIVGHDPTFSYLPGYLIGATRLGATGLKTGAVALVDTGTAPPGQGSAILKALIQPKTLAR